VLLVLLNSNKYICLGQLVGMRANTLISSYLQLVTILFAYLHLASAGSQSHPRQGQLRRPFLDTDAKAKLIVRSPQDPDPYDYGYGYPPEETTTATESSDVSPTIPATTVDTDLLTSTSVIASFASSISSKSFCSTVSFGRVECAILTLTNNNNRPSRR
jgi:hypothetical protein